MIGAIGVGIFLLALAIVQTYRVHALTIAARELIEAIDEDVSATRRYLGALARLRGLVDL